MILTVGCFFTFFNMRYFYLLFLFLIPFYSINAQNTFSKNIDIDGYSDTGTGVIEFQGKYFIAASSLCEENTLDCFAIISTDKTGNEITITQYNLSPLNIESGNFPNNTGILIKNDSFLFTSGVVYQEGNNPNFNNFLMKSTLNGDSIWLQTYGGQFNEVNNTVVSKTDTSLLLYSDKNLATNPFGDDVIWLLETDLDGNVVWEGTYGGQFGMVARQDIAVLENGNVVFSYLNCESTIACDTTYMTVTLIDDKGVELWTSEIAAFAGILGSTPFSSIVPLDDGGFVVSFKREVFSGNVPGPPVLFWLDSLGNVTHQHNFQNDHISSISDMFLSSKGEVIGIGSFDLLLSHDLGFSVWVFAFSQSGEPLWERTILDMNYPIDNYWVNAATETSDGGFILTGSVLAETYDVWLLKLDSMGCLIPDCEDLQILTNDTEVELAEKHKLFEIYPNPVKGENIKIERKEFSLNMSGYKFKLVNALGQVLIKNKLKGQNINEITLTNVVMGIYYLVIEDSKGQIIQIEKLVIS